MPNAIDNDWSDHLFCKFAAEFTKDAKQLKMALEADMIVQKFEEFVGGFIRDHGFEAGQIGLDLFGCLQIMDDRPYAL